VAVKAEIKKQQKELDEAVRAAASNLADAKARVAELSNRDQTVAGEIAALEVFATSVTSGQILGEFVAERVGSTDYRKPLGTAALAARAITGR
jgi:hypothetical protein